MTRRSGSHQTSIGWDAAQGPLVATYQTRISDYGDLDRLDGDAALSAYAELYGQVQRKLFAEVAAGRSAVLLKSEYIKEHGIPARMFNAVRVSLDGKVASVRESQRLQQDSLQRRIAWAERQVSDAAERGRWDQVHQKKRRLANRRHRLAGLEADIAEGLVRLCFGSKRLWRKQHHLEANGYASHGEWLEDWQAARSDEFFVLGSRDETAGCQICVASVADDGTLTLKLRLPDCLANQHGKSWSFRAYGLPTGTSTCWRLWGAMLSTLSTDASTARRRLGPPTWARRSATGSSGMPRVGGCLLAPLDVPVVTDRRRGAIGVDLNADHLAVADDAGQLPERLASAAGDLRQEHYQAEALIGDAVASVVQYACCRSRDWI